MDFSFDLNFWVLIILILVGSMILKLIKLQKQINKLQDTLYNDRITQIRQNLSLIKSNLGKPCRLIKTDGTIKDVLELLRCNNNIIAYKISTGDNFDTHYAYLEDIELVELTE